MCSLQQNSPPEKTKKNGNIILKINNELTQQQGGNKPDLQLDRNDCTQPDVDTMLSPSEESYRSLPSIPFSNTFGKSETLRNGEFRLSIDSKQPLRRRARSSEGCILRNRNKRIHEEIQSEIAFDKNSKFASIPAMYTNTNTNVNVNVNDETRRRKNQNHRSSPSPERIQQDNKSKYNKRDKLHIIPVEHPFKIVWDVLTVILSIAHSYLTHMAIRDRRFESSPFISFCQAWFLVDIFLNFFTERKTSTGEIISDHRRIVARYLTSWFAVDVLSIFPWEVLYVKPLIELQNRRGFFKKSFFRSKAVVRVTAHLRGRHFRWFGTVAKRSKQHGVGAQRLLRLIIKYVPKYNMFLRNMKCVIAMRILRFVHWSRRSYKNIDAKPSDASTKSMSTARGDDDNSLPENDDNTDFRRQQRFQIVYDWESIEDDDDDGVPL
jgi:tryptophan-rich sensory protein